MIKFLKFLQSRFEAKSFKHLLIIFLVFSISGSLTVYLSYPILDIIKFFFQFENSILQIILRIIIIFPLYQLILLLVGIVFGEFRYFLKFEKRVFKKFILKRN